MTIHQTMWIASAENLGTRYTLRENPAGGCTCYDVITPWPDMTRSIFSAKDAQRLPQRVLKISARYDKPFSVHFEKTSGGVIQPPLGVLGLSKPMSLIVVRVSAYCQEVRRCKWACQCNGKSKCCRELGKAYLIKIWCSRCFFLWSDQNATVTVFTIHIKCSTFT